MSENRRNAAKADEDGGGGDREDEKIKALRETVGKGGEKKEIR